MHADQCGLMAYRSKLFASYQMFYKYAYQLDMCIKLQYALFYYAKQLPVGSLVNGQRERERANESERGRTVEERGRASLVV